MTKNLWIIAQADGNQSVVSAEPLASEANAITVQPSSSPPRTQGSSYLLNLGLLAVMFVFLYLIIFREPKRKQQQQKKMLESLQKNDKVLTIGGIIGTVVEVKGDEVILKVDDSNNTRLRFKSSAIACNLSASEKKTS